MKKARKTRKPAKAKRVSSVQKHYIDALFSLDQAIGHLQIARDDLKKSSRRVPTKRALDAAISHIQHQIVWVADSMEKIKVSVK